ncbi:putative NAD kinase 2, chloroplastic [Sesbania bispinosa]|nr:putative NAD kinase 2, chloroplastic [Sesbania bispinosa]
MRQVMDDYLGKVGKSSLIDNRIDLLEDLGVKNDVTKRDPTEIPIDLLMGWKNKISGTDNLNQLIEANPCNGVPELKLRVIDDSLETETVVPSGLQLGGDHVGAGPMRENQLVGSLGEDVLDQDVLACKASPGVAAQHELIGLVKVCGPQLETGVASCAFPKEDPLGLLLGDNCASVDGVGAVQMCEQLIQSNVVRDKYASGGHDTSTRHFWWGDCWLEVGCSFIRDPNVKDRGRLTKGLLDKEPSEIATVVWHMGLELGVSGFEDANVLINRLEEMEKRDRATIRRS